MKVNDPMTDPVSVPYPPPEGRHEQRPPWGTTSEGAPLAHVPLSTPKHPEPEPEPDEGLVFELDADAEAQADERPSTTIKIGGRVWTATCPDDGVLHHIQDPQLSEYEAGEMLRRGMFGAEQYAQLRQMEIDGQVSGAASERAIDMLMERFRPFLEQRGRELEASGRQRQ